MTKPLSYAVVIATCDRPGYLVRSVQTILAQTRPPLRLVIVDSSRTAETETWALERAPDDVVIYRRVPEASAARQRNLGARAIATDLIAFIDDDVELPPSLLAALIEPFEAPDGENVGGVAGRIAGTGHPRPSRWLRLVYRLLAGYEDPHYGARLFGPALNTFPCYEGQEGLIPAEWLSSTCVVYRRDVFERERFPEFDGYSALEDVHLSARIARTHRLYFHAGAVYRHLDAPSAFKRDRSALAAQAMRHRRVVAREIMELGRWTVTWKQFLHRLLNTVALGQRRPPGWWREMRGTWKS
jgi:GT2 family glycosyltransferase